MAAQPSDLFVSQKSEGPSRTSLTLFYCHSFCAILASVTLNGTTAFLLSDRAHLPIAQVTSALSTVVLVDEVWALVGNVFWGALADSWGIRSVVSLSHLLAAGGLAFTAIFGTSLAGIIIGRLLWSSGFSGLIVAMVSLIANLSVQVPAVTIKSSISEDHPLLGKSAPPSRSNGALLAGFLCVATGCGALVAALGVNRLPSKIGIPATYLLVAVIEVVMALACAIALRVKSGAAPAVSHVRSLARGFEMAWKDGEVALSCIGSFATRGQAIVTISFIPALVNEYFVSRGLCHLNSPQLPPDQVKEGCRAAFALASTLTGVSQLMNLVGAPACGIVLHKFSTSPSKVMFAGYLTGCLGFALLALLPQQDPRMWSFTLPAVILIGSGQAIGMTCSLALTADARQRHSANNEGAEVAGAISGVYSLSGGVGIIVVVKTGGILAQHFGATSGFTLEASVLGAAALAAFAFAVWSR